MTASIAEPIARAARRERVFIRFRFGALVLMGLLGTVIPGQPEPLLLPLWAVVTSGLLLNLAFWLLLRVRATVPHWLPPLASAADIIGLLVFVSLTGGPRSPLWVFAFVAVAAAAMRQDAGGVVAATCFAAGNFALNLMADMPALNALFGAIVAALAYLLLALAVGWLIRDERASARLVHEQARQALQHGQMDVKSFAQLAGTLARNTNYEESLRQMLDLSILGLRSRGHSNDPTEGMILLFAPGLAETLYVAAAHRLKPEDEARRLSPVSGAINTALESVECQFVSDARKDPMLSQFSVVKNSPSAVVMPLRAGLSLFGVVVFLGRSDLLDIFGLRAELIEVYASQAAMAVQNAQLYDQVRQERDRVIDSEEKARHELARDLHDGPINQVASLTMGIDFVRRMLDRDPEQAKTELESLHRVAAQTARDMRLTMYRLRPLALEQAGLSQALDQYLTRLRAERDKPKFVLTVDRPETFEPRLSSNAAMMVFDIMTEAVNNAVKHAHANTVQIELRDAGDNLIASTRDDGCGFDVAAVTANYADRGSLGLLNIHERAELAQGEAAIESTPGHGAVVTVRVPLDKPAA